MMRAICSARSPNWWITLSWIRPAKAKAILAKAGITHAAFTLDVENKPPFITIAQALQGSFAAAGVKIELLPAAGSQVYSRVRARQHQAAIRLWIPDYFDAHSNASAFAYNDGKSSTVAWMNGWQIPQLNQQTLAALAEADPAKRRARYTAMQQALQRILSDAERASNVITRIRGMARGEAPQRQRFVLEAAVREMVQLSHNALEQRGIALHWDFAPNLPPAWADRIQIQQVVGNLLLNAIDAINEVHPSPAAPEIILTARRLGDRLELSVADTGPGVGENRPNPEGTGVGLANIRDAIAYPRAPGSAEF